MSEATEENELPFSFIRLNDREAKPRSKGITEIRGPYYSVLGKRALLDVLESMAPYIDSLKFAGGAFTIIGEQALEEIIHLCNQYDVMVSTGGFIEYVLTKGKEAVRKYIDTCHVLGFDIIELSAGFISLSTDDWLRLIEDVQSAGMKAKPEVGIQFGSGGATSADKLSHIGTTEPSLAIQRAKRFIEAGAYMIMIESEGITENTDPWRTEVPVRFVEELGMEKLMFEAAEPAVFHWYIQNFGPDVNLFIDHSQIIQLECLRQGLWGTQDLWGRVVSYK